MVWSGLEWCVLEWVKLILIRSTHAKNDESSRSIHRIDAVQGLWEASLCEFAISHGESRQQNQLLSWILAMPERL